MSEFKNSASKFSWSEHQERMDRADMAINAAEELMRAPDKGRETMRKLEYYESMVNKCQKGTLMYYYFAWRLFLVMLEIDAYKFD